MPVGHRKQGAGLPRSPLEAEPLASLCILSPHHPRICFSPLHLSTLFPDQVTAQLTHAQARTRRFPQRVFTTWESLWERSPSLPTKAGKSLLPSELHSGYLSPHPLPQLNQTQLFVEGSGKEEEPQGTGQHIPES